MSGVVVFAAFLIGWSNVGSLFHDWDRQAQTSLSLRNPYQTHRISASGDSIRNPTDFEVAWALEQRRGPWTQRHKLERERQDGLPYWNHVNFLERKGKRIIVGMSEEDNRENNFYKLGMWGQIRFGIFAIGVSRNYTGKWTDEPATMARLSLISDQVVGPVTLSTHGTLEVNSSRTHGRLRFEMRGMKHGRVEFVPFFVWDHLERASGETVDKWQAKCMFTIDLNSEDAA